MDINHGMKLTEHESAINLQSMKEREALFRRYGYDSDASLDFILSRALPFPGHVLEIGTGKGRFLALLARNADRVTTVDSDVAQQRAAKLHVTRTATGRRIRFALEDAGKLPWKAATFDTVVTVNTFHHLENPMRVFEEMLRVLRPGGKMVLCDFSPRGFQIFDRIHRFEGGTHPRLKEGLAPFGRLLRQRGWKTRRSKGCNQEILVASAPSASTDRNRHT